MSVPTLTLGVDPGLSGALAVLGPGGDVVALTRMPVRGRGKGRRVDAEALVRWLWHVRDGAGLGTELVAWVEQVSGYRGQGAVPTFAFGRAVGALDAALEIAGVEIAGQVLPKVWKRRWNLDKDKGKSLSMARRLWPDLSLPKKRDADLAEALLIARYGQGVES